MSVFQCYMGWSPSIGWTKDLCTQYINRLGHVSNAVLTTSSMHCILLFIHLVISPSSIWLKTIFSRPSPHTYSITVLCFDTYTPTDILQPSSAAKICFQSIHDFFPSYASLWWLSLLDIDTKFNSQILKGCQFSYAVWDGDRQLVASKNSAPKYIQRLV